MTETHPQDLDQPIGMVLMLVPSSAAVLVKQLRESNGGGMLKMVADELAKQIPVELPEKVGAVVESSAGDFFIRWTRHAARPWFPAEYPDQQLASDHLPLITKVHFEGVEL